MCFCVHLRRRGNSTRKRERAAVFFANQGVGSLKFRDSRGTQEGGAVHCRGGVIEGNYVQNVVSQKPSKLIEKQFVGVFEVFLG